MSDKINEVEGQRAILLRGGTQNEVDRQHKMGKLTARERIGELFDEGTFQEIDLWIRPIRTGFDMDKERLPGDGVITGIGEIHGRKACAYSHDFTVAGGTFGTAFHHKVTRLMETALAMRVPCVQIIDSGGERIHDWFGRPAHRPILAGKHPIGGTMTMYRAPGIMSGVIPQITIMLGPMYAGSAYVPTMADFMIMRNKTAFMSVASPSLLKVVTYQDVTQEQIGGAELHAAVTGTADFLVESDQEATRTCRELMTFIPSSCTERPPLAVRNDDPDRSDGRLSRIVPEDLSHGYDMHEIIRCIVDNGDFLELQRLFARSIIVGFGRLNGSTVGVVANNPGERKGILDIDTCDKEARFIRCCDSFNVPLIFLVDTPGFLPGLEQEQSRDGLMRTIPKPVFAICEATVPMITVHVGKCVGLSRLVMGNLRMGIDFAYSWPSAQVARIDPQLAARTIYRQEISNSEEPERAMEDCLMTLSKTYINHPYHAAEQAMVNDIIDPPETRRVLIRALESLASKQPAPRPWRKHSLIPQ